MAYELQQPVEVVPVQVPAKKLQQLPQDRASCKEALLRKLRLAELKLEARKLHLDGI